MQLTHPGAIDSGDDRLRRDTLQSLEVLGVLVVPIYHTFHPVLGFAQPAVAEILEDAADLGLGAGDVRDVLNVHRKSTSQQSPEVSSRMCQPVRLVSTIAKRDEDPEVVDAGNHLDRCSREFCTNLEAT